MKKFVIRVDSSTQIGSGHLMRCLTLAKQLQKGDTAEIFFVSRDLDGNLNHLITQEKFNLILLPRHNFDETLTGYAKWLTVPQAVDAQETIERIKSLGHVDKLIIDSYAIDTQWETALRPFVGEIFVIDDLANRKHNCDVLLDQNFYRDMETRYNGLVPPHCKLKLGPQHALLREEFYIAKKNLRKRDGTVKNILVFYGGVDLTNETMKALQALTKINLANVTVNVVVGERNSNKNLVAEFCKRHGFNFYCQVNNMAELMNAADLSLGAGGTTTWERLFLELPTIVTAIAENQLQSSDDCNVFPLIHYLGYYDEVTVQKIVDALKNYNF